LKERGFDMGYGIGLGALNVILALVLGPLFEGFTRKYIKANIAHSRVGPLVGPLQPFYDIFKLLGKEDLEIGGVLQKIAPMLCMASVLTAALLVPIGGRSPLEFWGDFIVLAYFLGLASISVILGAIATGTSYSVAGGTREMMLFLLLDLAMIVSFLTAMVNTHSLRILDWVTWEGTYGPNFSMIAAMIAALMVLIAQFGKIPFDIPEAEQEVMGGPFVEMSGPKLALFKWALWAKQFVVASLFIGVFIPWPLTGWLWLNLIVNLVKVLILFVIIGLIEVLMPRLRIDQAIKFYAVTFIIGIIAIVMAYFAA
jgi:NADH-quinone oxidoreductase subunit H